jgi:hypothetical protein
VRQVIAAEDDLAAQVTTEDGHEPYPAHSVLLCSGSMRFLDASTRLG